MTTYVISKEFYADGPSMFSYILRSPGAPAHLEFSRLKDAKACVERMVGRPVTWSKTRSDTGLSELATEYTAEA